MRSSILFAALLGARQRVLGAYTLKDNYSPSNFFSMFNFWTAADPTNGNVKYLDQSTAQSQGIISTTASSVYIGVDHINVTPQGRSSIRIQSKIQYTHGLFILDLAHMPGSICGIWPAFWTLGPNNWPQDGEIDILEGVNTQSRNSMALHTTQGCTITGTGESGTVLTTNCWAKAPGQASNSGCGVSSNTAGSYGDDFNTAGGGLYVMEWTSQAIKIWFFTHSTTPPDILSNSPNPAQWGVPQANFAGDCPIDSHFANHQIVFDLTFCGDWAGNVWASTPSCSSKAATCADWVINNPAAFAEAYWRINSLTVYSQ
ncbi:putative endo-1,3(4)-beta-glucanase [Mytilinidion resinicola]|uniref:endo-1,3(4)-beta-glucanase n=1 Tax=Mytilinidion resinicola TaxID=574789 RepID=A0A6A6YLG2_9PEZI|nr:putative endo-1,3(4)-beta-glucanase [Mytilinidion resinicola]KAF2809621.1 putative endo-1,3(4)-beta-glucanase [Mytilinidion resinicola]